MNTNQMSKIELHCHIDGSIRPSTAYELAIKEGIVNKDITMDEMENKLKVTDECASLVDYLTKFDIPIALMQTTEHIERIVYEVVEDAANTNVKYIELRFAPHFCMNGGLSFDEVVEAAIKGLKKAEASTGTFGNLILCCMRHYDPQKSVELVNDAKKYLNKGVVAIDLAGDEHNFPPELHKEAFDLAHELGFKITIHAGETGLEENIKKSIEILHANRIGHGVYAKKGSTTYKLLKEQSIALEMCPTSNVQTHAVDSFESHPIKRFLDDGIKSTINTDNMTVSNVNLNEEYAILEEHLDYTEDDFKKSYINSVGACFATDEVKKELLKLI